MHSYCVQCCANTVTDGLTTVIRWQCIVVQDESNQVQTTVQKQYKPIENVIYPRYKRSVGWLMFNGSFSTERLFSTIWVITSYRNTYLSYTVVQKRDLLCKKDEIYLEWSNNWLGKDWKSIHSMRICSVKNGEWQGIHSDWVLCAEDNVLKSTNVNRLNTC